MRDYPVGEIVDTHPATAPDRHQVLEGEHVLLCHVRPQLDAADLFTLTHGEDADPGQWTYMSFGPFSDTQDMEAWLNGIVDSTDPLFFTVHDRTREKPVGVVSFLNVQLDHRTIELGNIWYAPAVQQTAVNTETLFLLLRHCFEDLGFRRVEWKCDSLNQRSRRAAERLGFVFEGVFRHHFIVKGRNRDTAWYSMLDSEWQALSPVYQDFLERTAETTSLMEMISGRGGQP